MKKIIVASILSLMLSGVGSANAAKISASANEVVLNGKVLQSSRKEGTDVHYFIVNYKKRVWICQIYYTTNDSAFNPCLADN